MERISVTTASDSLTEILNRVMYQGAVFELEWGNKILHDFPQQILYIPFKWKNSTDFLQQLPSLGDDAEPFAQDIKAIRQEMAKERNPWA